MVIAWATTAVMTLKVLVDERSRLHADSSLLLSGGAHRSCRHSQQALQLAAVSLAGAAPAWRARNDQQAVRAERVDELNFYVRAVFDHGRDAVLAQNVEGVIDKDVHR
jgi:hypothetical protein